LSWNSTARRSESSEVGSGTSGAVVDRSTKQRVLSPPFLVAAASVGALGFAVPAYAVDSSGLATNTYYAQTGSDGVIHCASAGATLYTGGGAAYVDYKTYTQADLYCVNNEQHPAGYLETYGAISTQDGGFCFSTPWSVNSSTTSSETGETPVYNVNSSDCPEVDGLSGLQGWGVGNDYLNGGWQLGYAVTSLVPRS
jgi:hypothetical protein